jgi:hypothetical protein
LRTFRIRLSVPLEVFQVLAALALSALLESQAALVVPVPVLVAVVELAQAGVVQPVVTFLPVVGLVLA